MEEDEKAWDNDERIGPVCFTCRDKTTLEEEDDERQMKITIEERYFGEEEEQHERVNKNDRKECD